MLASRVVKSPGDTYVQPQEPERRELFKRLVDVISIETHSYCNRKCWFCPNSFIDRQSKREYLPERVYLQMLEDLNDINYSQVISFARYMEPFADPVIYERIAQARTIVPHAHVRANTNGDYINATTLPLIEAAGLKQLVIQLYLPSRETQFTEEAIVGLANKKKQQLGISFERTKRDPNWMEWSGRCGKLVVEMRGRNFQVNGENRGGIDVSGEYVRTAPCDSAFNVVCVHYSQEMIGCCHLRSDHPDHKMAILGTVDDARGSLFDVYTAERAAAWRGRILGRGPKPLPCRNCAVGIPVDQRR